MSNDTQIFEKINEQKCSDSQFIESFFQPIIKNGIVDYVSNVDAKMMLLQIDELILPTTINEGEYSNSFVCSPFSYYVSYAMLYLDLIKNKLGRKICRTIMQTFSRLLPAADLNKVVCVNNWPFATNLWPKISKEQIAAIVKNLVSTIPEHAIVFRSFNEDLNRDLLDNLKLNGFSIIASRQIFYTDARDSEIFKTRIFKSDLKALRETPYQILETSQIREEHLTRLIDLYGMVYLEKYSDLNPHHTVELLKLGIETKTIHLRALVKDGQIDGVVGFYVRNGVMTCPFFGYDISKPQDDKLYRLLCTLLMVEAGKLQVIFHQSSGAAFYKTLRRARSCVDYTAVYDRHLSLKRRLPWLGIRWVMNGIGIHFLKEA